MWFSPGPGEMLIVLVVALLLFGERLPAVARSIGKSFNEFQKGLRAVEDEIRSASYDAETASSSSLPKTSGESSEESQDEIAPKFDLPDSDDTSEKEVKS